MKQKKLNQIFGDYYNKENDNKTIIELAEQLGKKIIVEEVCIKTKLSVRFRT